MWGREGMGPASFSVHTSHCRLCQTKPFQEEYMGCGGGQKQVKPAEPAPAAAPDAAAAPAAAPAVQPAGATPKKSTTRSQAKSGTKPGGDGGNDAKELPKSKTARPSSADGAKKGATADRSKTDANLPNSADRAAAKASTRQRSKTGRPGSR